MFILKFWSITVNFRTKSNLVEHRPMGLGMQVGIQPLPKFRQVFLGGARRKIHSQCLLLKVHLTPKYFFGSNKSLHLFETHCAFLPCFNPNLDLLQAVKVTKSGQYICCTTKQVRDMGLFLGWRHKVLCMHVYKDLIRCKSVCDVHPGIDPYPLLARSCNR